MPDKATAKKLVGQVMVNIACPACNFMLLRNSDLRTLTCTNPHCEFYQQVFSAPHLPLELVVKESE
jgi:hypothetical protein